MAWLGTLGGALAALIAVVFLDSPGAALVLLGAVAGGMWLKLSRRVTALEKALAERPAAVAAPAAAPAEAPLTDQPGAQTPQGEPIPESVVAPDDPAAVGPPPPDAPPRAADEDLGFQPLTQPAPVDEPADVPALARVQAEGAAIGVEVDERAPSVTSSIGQSVLAWFRGGNTIVRVAVLILFIGVAFLLRYAAEHATVPIELRLAAVAMGGIGLAALGWVLRRRRRGYGLSLQGAGVGVLYLTIFAAFRLYELLPAGLAFALLVALAAFSALLAVVQNALPLAVLGFGGGFLAPVLASTGQGSHVTLFGYYLVLNLAIAWISQRQAWKLLNLVGFTFTFVIGALWGARFYRPEYFATTEPFLVAHFLLYLFISVQYSRQLVTNPAARGLPYVDGSLLFGVPVAAFALQAALVKDMPYALALSSAVLSGIYLLLGRWLWRTGGQQMRLLTEGLLALGVVFLIMVTPLALDARWTGAAWALQGAGIVWLGLRQQRWWAAGMGGLLQLGAALSFWVAHEAERHGEPALAAFANGYFVGAWVLALSALYTAHLLLRQATQPPPAWLARLGEPARALLPTLHWVFLLLGLLHAFGGTWSEWQVAPWPAGVRESWRLAVLLGLFALALEVLHGRLRWPELSAPGRALLVFGLLVSLGGTLDRMGGYGAWMRLTSGGGWFEVALLLGVGIWLQRRLAAGGGATPLRRSLAPEHLALGWYATLQGAMVLHAMTAHLVARHEAWTPLAVLLPPTLLAWWLLARGASGRWPVAAHPDAWRTGYFLPLLLLQGLWVLVVNLFNDGSMSPLPYVPLLNPVDLGHALLALYALKLWRTQALRGTRLHRPLQIAAGVLGFAWVNSLIVRTLHHWAGTPMWEQGALGAGLVQTCFTIAWTLMALATMLYATRRAAPALARPLWVCGAALLGVVVLKLFLVDLSNIGTLERIVSFLGVGGLMLVIGYVSPLPPARPAQNGEQATSPQEQTT